MEPKGREPEGHIGECQKQLLPPSWVGIDKEYQMPRRELTEDEAFERAVNFSDRYVARGPYSFFPEPEVVTEVQKGLGENERTLGYRYCP